jgi:catechol 2,3-dioxygenase-like lactoylglutathione lyase family enzyme
MPEFRVAFIANDYDATVGFFTDVMGLQVLRSFEEGGKGTILLAADGQIEVFSPDVGWGAPGVVGAKLAWQVDDAAAEHERVVASGGVVTGELSMKPWGHRSFVVEGPDGWSITLYEIVVPQ